MRSLSASFRRGLLPDTGLYLTRAWTNLRAGAAESLEGLYRLQFAASTDEAIAVLHQVGIPGNWVIADRQQSIGYQQPGRHPRRAHSGLFPLPAWEAANRWQGLVPGQELEQRIDPPEGFIATANDYHNQPGGPLAVNACTGQYRVERIKELLREKPRFDLDDMKRIQADLFSKQAERYMVLLRPLIPDDMPAGRRLLEWDLCYRADSQATTLFERIYEATLREVFGKRVFGVEAWEVLCRDTELLRAYFHFFDDFLLTNDSSILEQWFSPPGRPGGFPRSVIGQTLAATDLETVPTWGESRQIRFRSRILGEAMPKLPILNRGPFALEGGRGSIVQTLIFRLAGQDLAIAPSYRYACDLGEASAETSLTGRPSGSPLSRYYACDLQHGHRYEYKQLDGSDASDRSP